MPEYFLALETLPLTASGKILKRDLVRKIEDGVVNPRPVRFEGRTNAMSNRRPRCSRLQCSDLRIKA